MPNDTSQPWESDVTRTLDRQQDWVWTDTPTGVWPVAAANNGDQDDAELQ